MTSTTTINTASRQQKSRSLKKLIHIVWLCLDHPWPMPCYLHSSKLHVFVLPICRWAFCLTCFFSTSIVKSCFYGGEAGVDLRSTFFFKRLLQREKMRIQITNCNGLVCGKRKTPHFLFLNPLKGPKSWGETKRQSTVRSVIYPICSNTTLYFRIYTVILGLQILGFNFEECKEKCFKPLGSEN